MTFVNYPQRMPPENIGQPEELVNETLTPVVREEDQLDPSVLETIGAAFSLQNTVASTLTSNALGYDQLRQDEDFDFQEEIKGYEQYADRFVDVYNREAMNAIKLDIDQETEERKILDASGWLGTASEFGAAIIDLPTLIPGGTFVRGSQLGYSAVKSGLAVGAASGVAAASAEAILQSTQQTRTALETGAAIGGSVILGGLLGYGGARLLTRGEWDQLSKAIETDLQGFEGIEDVQNVTETIIDHLKTQPAGAQSVDQLNLKDLGISGPAAERVAQLTAALRINPGVQSMLSPASSTRRIFAQLAESPIARKYEEAGETLGAAVETELKLIERGAYSQAVRASRKIFKEMRKAGIKMSRADFDERVGRATVRADTDMQGNQYVTRAARVWRKELFDKVKDEGIKVSAWPEDIAPTTSASYLTRMYKYDALVSREDEFREIAGKWVREQLEALPAEKFDEYDFVSKSDMEGHIDEVVDSIYANLTGKGEGEDVPGYIVPVTRGPLKERVFKIDDELIEDFLERDIELVGRFYARTAGAEISLKRKFGRADMKDQIAEIKNEYKDLRKAAKNMKERRKLNEAEKRDLTNIRAFRDMIRGTYNKGRDQTAWGKMSRAALSWNYMRLLGGVTVSSMPDIGRMIGFVGVRNLLRGYVVPLATNLKAIKLSINEGKIAGAVTETVMNARLATLAELTDPMQAAGSSFERLMDNAVNTFSRVTFLSHWNDFLKGSITVLSQNRMIDNAFNWTKLDKIERRWMANTGIGEDMANEIARQVRAHGRKEGGVWVANTEAWTNPAAQRAFRAGIAKSADVQIVTKGVSDAPLALQSNTGRVLMQFKSFALASHQRVLISGLQGRPRHTAEMLLFATLTGMMVSYFKNIEAGRTEDAQKLLDNPGRWIGEGLDRSGLFAIPFEVSNTLEKFGGAGIVAGLQALFADEDRGGPVSRYASRNVTGTLAGPTAGIFEDMIKIAQQFGSGDVKRSGINAAFRQIPGRSLFGIRPAVEYGLKPLAEEVLVDD